MHTGHLTSSDLRKDHSAKLRKRESQGYLRELQTFEDKVDFCSNDYLGLANSALLKFRLKEWQKVNASRNGSTGSRLISGNSSQAEKLESWLAEFYGSEAGLLFNSGYDANVGMFSCIAREGDCIFYDELCHGSIKDGVKLSRANSLSFAHNNLENLALKLENWGGNKVVAVESVYSMDGDVVPLKELVSLCASFNAQLVIDEAHAVGVIGRNGEGLTKHLGLEEQVFARVATFGKGIGSHGSVILSSTEFKNYLTNYAHSFIYSTALPPHSIAQIEIAHSIMTDWKQKRKQLIELSNYFQQELSEYLGDARNLAGHIFSLEIPGNEAARKLSYSLLESGIYVKAILFPTVPEGKERLRISLHAFNTREEVHLLTSTIKTTLN